MQKSTTLWKSSFNCVDTEHPEHTVKAHILLLYYITREKRERERERESERE